MGLRKMLNVFVVSEDENQKLELASQYMKENLKKHLDKVKMVTDRIEVFDAQILNVGLHLDITLSDKSETASALPRIREFLFDEITLSTPEIGQPFSIGEVERILAKMPIIQRINKVELIIKSGSDYASTRYEKIGNVAPDGSEIYMPEDFIWEIKYATDITGNIK